MRPGAGYMLGEMLRNIDVNRSSSSSSSSSSASFSLFCFSLPYQFIIFHFSCPLFFSFSLCPLPLPSFLSCLFAPCFFPSRSECSDEQHQAALMNHMKQTTEEKWTERVKTVLREALISMLSIGAFAARLSAEFEEKVLSSLSSLLSSIFFSLLPHLSPFIYSSCDFDIPLHFIALIYSCLYIQPDACEHTFSLVGSACRTGMCFEEHETGYLLKR